MLSLCLQCHVWLQECTTSLYVSVSLEDSHGNQKMELWKSVVKDANSNCNLLTKPVVNSPGILSLNFLLCFITLIFEQHLSYLCYTKDTRHSKENGHICKAWQRAGHWCRVWKSEQLWWHCISNVVTSHRHPRTYAHTHASTWGPM